MAANEHQPGLLRSIRDVSFPEPSHLFGEAFGAALARCERPVVCFCEPSTEAVAYDYLELVGRGSARVEVCSGGLDHARLESSVVSEVVPIFLMAATDPRLKGRFFGHPRLLMFSDHHYVPSPDHESPRLFVVGTTRAGIDHLQPGSNRAAMEQRARRGESLRQRSNGRLVGPDRFGDILRSPAVRQIRIHGLGPAGTNIARCCEWLVQHEDVRGKSEVVIHGRKVDPMEYAEIAAREAGDGVLPLHVECAVYFALGELFSRRPREVVFANHYYLPLDGMQLAARPSFEPSAVCDGPLRLASHPSPLGLVSPLLERRIVANVTASSNSDAAEMVRLGEAETCITTETGARQSGLATLHRFGSPTMLFTVGASVANQVLQSYLA